MVLNPNSKKIPHTKLYITVIIHIKEKGDMENM